MNRVLLFTFSIFFSALVSGQNAEKDHRNLVLKTGLFAPIFNTSTLAFEKGINDNTSLQGQLILNWDGGFGLFTDYKFYLSDAPAPDGVFISPFQGFGFIEGLMAGTGLTIGMQKIYKNRITIEGFIGPIVIYGPGSNGMHILVRPGLTVGVLL